jgi:hypothetical protein
MPTPVGPNGDQETRLQLVDEHGNGGPHRSTVEDQPERVGRVLPDIADG